MTKKVYIAGHRGMVGSAIARALEAEGGYEIITRTRGELDLCDANAVAAFFAAEKPQWVFLAAAKVGGIYANNTYPVEFLLENTKIQNNIIHAAYKNNVKKLLFLGSACIYPRKAPQPIREEYLLTDILEPTNEPYAIAKIAGIKLCQSYHHQYGCNFISIMPNNLYGPNDNYDLETSHVLPALVRKLDAAKKNKADCVEIWGTGSPKREFMHVDDMASACVFLMNNLEAIDLYNGGISHINAGTGQEVTIKELALTIKAIIGFEGDLVFNDDYPDGMPRKLLDVTRLDKMGWKSKIKLEEGVKSAYDWYVNNVE